MAKEQRAYMMWFHTFRGLCHLGRPLSIERLYTSAKYEGKKGLEEGKWRQNVGGGRERERERGKREERKRWRERERVREREQYCGFQLGNLILPKTGGLVP